jgi:hypothetical protein
VPTVVSLLILYKSVPTAKIVSPTPVVESILVYNLKLFVLIYKFAKEPNSIPLVLDTLTYEPLVTGVFPEPTVIPSELASITDRILFSVTAIPNEDFVSFIPVNEPEALTVILTLLKSLPPLVAEARLPIAITIYSSVISIAEASAR